MKKRGKLNLIIIIFVIVLVLGLGYAYLTTTLSINGTTEVDSNTWNIYWDNVQVKSGSVTASTPTIDSSKTTVSFSVHLSKPGDFYEFTVDAKNDGTIDAMIDDITKTTNIPTYINYSVTYSDGIEVLGNQLLTANTKEVYKVRVEYRTDINPSDLPSTAQSLNLTFGLTYVQADSNAVLKPYYSYTINSENTQIGQAIQENITQYNTGAEAMAAIGHPFYLKHKIENGIITESYVEFVVTEAMAAANPGMTVGVYTLRGGIDENSLTTQPIHEANKLTILDAFGSERCFETWYFYGSVVGLYAHASTGGHIRAYDNSWECDVYIEGDSRCGTKMF